MDHIKFLESILGKILRLHTNDSRMFVGEFKCTDNVSLLISTLSYERCKADSSQEHNIILSQTYEYRPPAVMTVQATAESSSARSVLRADVTSRFLGLIVVPGQYINKIEIEEP